MNPAAAQAAAEAAAAQANTAAATQNVQPYQIDEPIDPLSISDDSTLLDTVTAISARVDDPGTSRENAARLYEIGEKLFSAQKEAMSVWLR